MIFSLEIDEAWAYNVSCPYTYRSKRPDQKGSNFDRRGNMIRKIKELPV